MAWTTRAKSASRRSGVSRVALAGLLRGDGEPGSGHMVSHGLGDTFGVDLLEKGVPMEEVCKLLGHESIKTTEKHYAKWVKGRQDRLDSLVTETWTKRKKVAKV
jgi:integrase/recombinase XerD